MAQLTTLSKILITGVVATGLFFLGRYLYKSGYFGGGESGTTTNNGNNGNNGNTGGADVIRVGVVTWPGYVGGQYFNEGFEANEQSRYFKDYGFKVEFKILDDFTASRDAFKADQVDLLWATVDALPTEIEGLAEYDPRIVFQADWSRGGDAIVVRRGINNAGELKGKTIAVAPMTPSHTFLIWMLDAAGLKTTDVSIKEVPSAIDAADAFKSNSVDAAVVWSPDDAACVSAVAGSRVLQSTKNASHIIADIFIAKKKFIDANKQRLQQLYEGWMKGAAEINSKPDAKSKAVDILAKGLGQPREFFESAINNVRLVTHGDNLNFYGLNADYKGVKGEDLYNKMKVTYNQLGFAPAQVKSWGIVAEKSLVQSANLSGAEHAAEGEKTFTAVKEEDKTKEAISTKRVTISFPSGSSTLDENAKYIIDMEFTPIAKAFSNARIRIEGNTDSKGARDTNVKLSMQRAQAVADYLIKTYQMPAERFIVVGNGPDNPVADNSSEDGRSKNRRTDFELVAD